ncbi:hypothetical protein ACF3NA_00355 [Alkanindiges sp. WGS2144]
MIIALKARNLMSYRVIAGVMEQLLKYTDHTTNAKPNTQGQSDKNSGLA